MNPLVSSLAVWLLLGVVMSTGARLFLGLQQAADAYLEDRKEEHAVRSCARAVAARRNLEAARLRLSRLWPDRAPLLATVADDLQSDLAPISSFVPPPDASGRCVSSGPRRLAASPHLEHHPGQPVPWPNWTLRFSEGDSP